MLIRQATQEDVSSIAELERAVSSPWSETQIAAEIAYSAAILTVASDTTDNRIIGWCSIRHMAPEAELLKIVVHSACRRAGLGEKLLREALKNCAAVKCNELFLEVRAKNLPARNLYHKLGFKVHGLRKNYYSQPVDDAILYRREIDSLNDN